MRILSLGILLATVFTALAQEKRPNLLFIYTDDQRWDALGFIQKQQGGKARFPWLKTPNLDRLRSQGAHFSNAFCTTSLCSPSRATFLTGQYTHTHGVTNNHTPLPPGTVTYATLLQKAGYTTGFVGKWHMGNQPERPGFDFSASFDGQGKFYDCPVTIRKNGGVRQVIEEKWIDDASADYAIGFLRENKDKPFSLTVGFKSVHGPREPETDFKAAYAGSEAVPVPSLQLTSPFRPEAKNGNSYRGENLLNYFRTLTSADRSLGRLLDELDKLGLDKNTVVIFTSDNGYYLGEHSLGDKRSAYEESIRLPFLIRSPFNNVSGKTIDPLVLNIDIAPTLLDFAGVEIPKEIQGRSLRPLLEEKPPADWRKSFLYEYFYERNFKNPTILGLRTTTDKIIVYPGREQWNEIYEVGKDPYELTNQFNNPDHADLKKQLLSELERLKQETRFQVPSTVDPDNFGNENPKRGKNRDLDL
ncbi:sulfatase [Luteolibacter yonseiensis]|uniref:Sulfatase n=1 Tax=Luteolibacter yonseiensis TaxID=1144680 RepID=A0A934V5S7_9BACT|nr:sulfatase [Luteolibacter yonseiensis]MBK1814267.1 sulfatase [Luteolibacter yonseiensis]